MVTHPTQRPRLAIDLPPSLRLRRPEETVGPRPAPTRALGPAEILDIALDRMIDDVLGRRPPRTRPDR